MGYTIFQHVRRSVQENAGTVISAQKLAFSVVFTFFLHYTTLYVQPFLLFLSLSNCLSVEKCAHWDVERPCPIRKFQRIFQNNVVFSVFLCLKCLGVIFFTLGMILLVYRSGVSGTYPSPTFRPPAGTGTRSSFSNTSTFSAYVLMYDTVRYDVVRCGECLFAMMATGTPSSISNTSRFSECLLRKLRIFLFCFVFFRPSSY